MIPNSSSLPHHGTASPQEAPLARILGPKREGATQPALHLYHSLWDHKTFVWLGYVVSLNPVALQPPRPERIGMGTRPLGAWG